MFQQMMKINSIYPKIQVNRNFGMRKMDQVYSTGVASDNAMILYN